MSKENKTIGALDKLIEKQAKEKLEKDIKEFCKMVDENPLWRSIAFNLKPAEINMHAHSTLSDLFSYTFKESYVHKPIVNALLEKYKENKASELLKNFEALNSTLKEKTS